MNYKLRILAKIPLVLVAAAAFGWVVMSLWNWLMPALFVGVHEVDYLHALGLLVLCRILFGGFRHGGHRGWHGHGHSDWHAKWHEKWHARQEQMTPEEREKFRKGMHAWHGEHSKD